MYESITYEIILKRMLDRVLEQDPNIDTREGSIIYNALAPAAAELQNMYIELDVILNESFADTAQRDYLIRRCAERGVSPQPSTKAILRGEFNIDVPIGSRFSMDNLNYKTIEKISPGVYKLECETFGTVGNESLGTLIPIEYIDGLTTAELTAVLIPGEDKEETEKLRSRYFATFDAQAFGGNVADYKERINKIQGVGGVKVYPAWNGGGTVKLVIIDSNYNVPSSPLIDEVQTLVDPASTPGQGVGFAPIGHVVTVVGVASTQVNISTNITYQEGWAWVDVEPYVNEAIDNYFNELAETWDSESNLIIRISQIETRLLNISGILDIADTTINGLAQNLVLGVNNIPTRGVVSG